MTEYNSYYYILDVEDKDGKRVMQWLFRSVDKERNWQKKNILALKDYYLQADVMEKAETDEGYRDKLDLIERFLGNEKGWIVDIGSHTCGEAEYLATKGYSIICTEINEYALEISKERTQKFGRDLLHYVACDGHNLPFQDASVHCVTFNESLHHMDNPERTLGEVFRILAPGGRVFFYEPYAYNPYRRLAEVRDYFTGTIEKSFGVGQLKTMLKRAGFEVLTVERHVAMPSAKKMERVSGFRRFLKQLYYDVSVSLPGIFGMVAVMARRPSLTTDQASMQVRPDFFSILQCPVTGTALKKTASGYENTNVEKPCRFKEIGGIPVLISADAEFLAAQTV